jgi:hypothetical protein
MNMHRTDVRGARRAHIDELALEGMLFGDFEEARAPSAAPVREIDPAGERLLSQLPPGFGFEVRRNRTGRPIGHLRRGGETVRTFETWDGYDVWTRAWTMHNAAR